MNQLYYCLTSNGMRATIAMKEAGIPFTPHPMDMAKGETRTPDFLTINPAGTAPVWIESEPAPLVLAQSGAILIHAAERSGRMLPTQAAQRALAWQWTLFACSDCAGASTGIGMAKGLAACEPAATQLYEQRLVKLLTVADEHLAREEWLTGNAFSMADVALFPVYEYRKAVVERSNTALPNLARWAQAMADRPAVREGMALIK